jgi:hypothetical protein
MTPTIIKAYEASAAIAAFRIVKFSDEEASSKIATAADNLDRLVGTTGKLGGGIGKMVDVVRGGIGGVTLGGTVKAGDWLTSDANGKAVATVTGGDQVIGKAEQPGVANDIIDYFCAPGVIGEEID